MLLVLRFLVALVRCRLGRHPADRTVETILHDGNVMRRTWTCGRCGRVVARLNTGRQGPKPLPYQRRQRHT